MATRPKPSATRLLRRTLPLLAALAAALPRCVTAPPPARLAVVVAAAPGREVLLAAADATWRTGAESTLAVIVAPGAADKPRGAPPNEYWLPYPDSSIEADAGARAAAALRIAHERLGDNYTCDTLAAPRVCTALRTALCRAARARASPQSQR